MPRQTPRTTSPPQDQVNLDDYADLGDIEAVMSSAPFDLQDIDTETLDTVRFYLAYENEVLTHRKSLSEVAFEAGITEATANVWLRELARARNPAPRKTQTKIVPTG